LLVPQNSFAIDHPYCKVEWTNHYGEIFLSCCASLSLFSYTSVSQKLWALSMMARARPKLNHITGLNFWKLCGSGTGEGFTPKPNWGVYGLIGSWESLDTAKSQIHNHELFRLFGRRATSSRHLLMTPITSRGLWSGTNPFCTREATRVEDRPIAALTRATLRARKASAFWKRVPDISARIGEDSSVLFKIGLGELPLIQQITFSIWPNTHAMDAFARTGAHAEAIRAVYKEGWFREDLYARFIINDQVGEWSQNYFQSQLRQNA